METIVYFDAIRAISKCHNRKIAVAFHVKICYADVFVLVFSYFFWFGRKGFLNEAYLRRTYLQGQLHVLAGKVASTCVEDAGHCEDGCSALQRRLQCTAGAVAVHCV